MRRLTEYMSAILAGASLMAVAPAQAQSNDGNSAAPMDGMAHHSMHHARRVVKPTPEQHSQIEQKLRQDGYVNWHDIRLNDDGTAWVVGDAVASDGNVFTLSLSSKDYSVVNRAPKALR